MIGEKFWGRYFQQCGGTIRQTTNSKEVKKKKSTFLPLVFTYRFYISGFVMFYLFLGHVIRLHIRLVKEQFGTECHWWACGPMPSHSLTSFPRSYVQTSVRQHFRSIKIKRNGEEYTTYYHSIRTFSKDRFCRHLWFRYPWKNYSMFKICVIQKESDRCRVRQYIVGIFISRARISMHYQILKHAWIHALSYD